jgi:hypothetical protein
MSAGKVLILVGLFLMVLGLLAYLGERLGLGLGRLPGDLVIRGERTTLYFPVVTCLVLSLLLSLGLWIVQWLRR